VGLAVTLVLVAVVAGTSNGRVTGPPLSPRSVGSTGARALVLFLEERGVEVRSAGVPRPDEGGVGLLLLDDLGDGQRDALEDWVRQGNTLVVTGESPLAPDVAEIVRGSSVSRGDCDIDGLDGVDRLELRGPDDDPDDDEGSLVEPDSALAVPVRFEVPDGAEGCFGTESAFVVSTELGRGRVVAVGSPEPFVNELLDEADNAALAADLLISGSDPKVVVVQGSLPGTGDTSVLDLIPDRFKQAFVQLALAFVVYAVWRSRRLGRPVMESQPVAIPGSALVAAVGGLRRRNGAADRAAHSLRTQTNRQLGQRYGLGRQTPPSVVAGVVAQRTGVDPERLRAVLDYRPITDESQLVLYTAELDRIRQEVLDGPGRAASH
jgi:hypothetical protein